MTNLELEQDRASPQRLYRCHCGQAIFFRNSLCVACGFQLGYDPSTGIVYPLDPGAEADRWQAETATGAIQEFVRCANLDTAAGCNWLVPVVPCEEPPSLCVACRLNRTIPDLSVAGNDIRWRNLEIAKRRLVSSLLRLRLPVASKVIDDPAEGLAFDFLSSPPEGPPVLTGHADGIITVNVDEAEDVKREQMRVQMNEPYRTILGNLRHEAGHYYWDRLIAHGPWIEPFRALFGDERADYSEALQRHHTSGPPADWQQSYVSAYATAHPWEDWAETWAHYLHMTDTLDTASSFLLQFGRSPITVETFHEGVLCQPQGNEPGFLPLVNSWVQLTLALNELSLSMGLGDFYPFVLSAPAVRKLHFVHVAIHRR